VAFQSHNWAGAARDQFDDFLLSGNYIGNVLPTTIWDAS